MTHKQSRVRKSNPLIEASYRLTLKEQRLLLSCVVQIHKNHTVTDEIFYSVTAQEIAKLAKIDINHAYIDLKKAAEHLFERRLTLREKPNGQGRTYLVTRWVQSVRYIPDVGRVELRFSREILPYLTQLTQQFTQYALGEVARMSSVYAIRLYELLVQWESVGEKEFSLKQLRDILQIETSYPSIKDFKKRIIDPAVEQINTHSSLQVTWTQRKTGRQVTHIRFTFHKKSNANPSKTNPPPKKLTREYILQHAKPGESWEQAECRLKSLE